MRHPVFVSAILLHSLTAAAAEVVVQTPKTVLVATVQHLRDDCGAAGSYDACTRFLAYRLEPSCIPDQDAWRMTTSATFLPYIVLYNLHSLSHELEHIGDVRESLQRYGDHLEQSRFASADDCRANASIASSSFADLIRGFAAQSNAARHPQLAKSLARSGR